MGIPYTETLTAQTNKNNGTSGSTQHQTDEFGDLITGPDQPSTNDTTPLGLQRARQSGKMSQLI
jgi:hypothetical protein